MNIFSRQTMSHFMNNYFPDKSLFTEKWNGLLACVFPKLYDKCFKKCVWVEEEMSNSCCVCDFRVKVAKIKLRTATTTPAYRLAGPQAAALPA